MANTNKPIMMIIVGINGAGKTTLYYEQIKPHLKNQGVELPFINADEIEKELYPNEVGQHNLEAAVKAGRLRRKYFKQKESFITETVYSHNLKVDLIDRAQGHGFTVILHHVHIKSPELANFRVQYRVKAGGHYVSEETIFTRYPKVIKNVKVAAKKADVTYVWENSEDNARKAQKHKFALQLEQGVLTKINKQCASRVKDVYKQFG